MLIRKLSFFGFFAMLIMVPNIYFGQSPGWKHLERAEHCVEHGQFFKAKMNLRRAESSDYGFCGNAHAAAGLEIRMLRARMAMAEEKPMEAYSLLDGVACGLVKCEIVDSLKVAALVAVHGKQKVAKGFETALNNLPDDFVREYFEDVELTLPFHESPFIIHSQFGEIPSRTPRNQAQKIHEALTGKDKWLLAVKELPFYTLLED